MHDPIILDSKPTKTPRRTYTKEFKDELIALCDRGDRSLAQVAMAHQINANLLRKWQRELHERKESNTLIPVHVSHPASTSAAPEYIEITLDSLSIKIMGTVDSNYVSSVIRALQ